jgi:hypothetical protein
MRSAPDLDITASCEAIHAYHRVDGLQGVRLLLTCKLAKPGTVILLDPPRRLDEG